MVKSDEKRYISHGYDGTHGPEHFFYNDRVHAPAQRRCNYKKCAEIEIKTEVFIEKDDHRNTDHHHDIAYKEKLRLCVFFPPRKRRKAQKHLLLCRIR